MWKRVKDIAKQYSPLWIENAIKLMAIETIMNIGRHALHSQEIGIDWVLNSDYLTWLNTENRILEKWKCSRYIILAHFAPHYFHSFRAALFPLSLCKIL